MMRQKLLAIFVVFGLGFLPMVAQGASSQMCYSPAEFEAEQGLRIHSELMVIALTCVKMPRGGQVMYTKYKAFTDKNQSLISNYETSMMAYFRRRGIPQPEKELHALRTGLANKISKSAITMSTLSFCNKYGSYLDQALSMDHGKLRRWAQQSWASTPTKHPICY